MYAAAPGTRDYDWANCPFFADCLYSSQRSNMVPSGSILTDATHGTLPNFSILTPSGGVTGDTAQHNFDSMLVGDNWLGKVISALMKGPQWSSTAIFLTYDDCGCFYDHVAPPAGFGIRVPMIVISPYVKPHYTDSHPASFTSVIAFTERVFGIQPLGFADTYTYAYMSMFNWSQRPLPPVAMVTSPIPAASKAFVATHKADPDDPT
jgi:phospholipase C